MFWQFLWWVIIPVVVGGVVFYFTLRKLIKDRDKEWDIMD